MGAVVQSDWLSLVLALLNVFQTLALAFMADRSRRVRAQDEALQRIGRRAVDRGI